MENKKPKRQYRLAPAFILLFLAQEKCYGSALLAKFREKIPFYTIDSPVIYRSLQELERENCVRSEWDTESPGPATRWYEITPTGLERLANYRQDIEARRKNLDYFLKTYDGMAD